MNESEQEGKKKDAFSWTPSLVPDFTQTQGKALFEEPSPEPPLKVSQLRSCPSPSRSSCFTPLQLGKVSSTILLLDWTNSWTLTAGWEESGKAPIEELLRELGKLYNPNSGKAPISLFIRKPYRTLYP